MPKRNDGNEQDLRVRPKGDAHSLDKDNPFTGAIPEGKDPCEDEHGDQVDIPSEGGTTPVPPVVYDWGNIPTVCPDGFSPSTLNELFMSVLKTHFGNPDNIFRENLKPFVYTEDPATSKIRIVMNTTWDPSKAGMVPSLIVKRGPQKPQRISIGDKAADGDPLLGENRYVRFLQGNHRIFIVSEVDGFTEDLGAEIFDLFTCLSPVFFSSPTIPFHDFQVVGWSELGILDGLGSTLGVAIDCTYVYEYAWTLTDISPYLRGTKIALTTQINTGAV